MAEPLNPHSAPPSEMKEVYKKFQKLDVAAIDDHSGILDFARRTLPPDVKQCDISELPLDLRQVFLDFLQHEPSSGFDTSTISSLEPARLFKLNTIPGLTIYPSLFPPPVQLYLLHTLLHRDLNSPNHKTNLHAHYHIPPEPTYFSSPPQTFAPKDPSIHSPITTTQLLNKKLRWMTLGGQYDWTNKQYPASQPPPFPQDIKNLIEGIFPMKSEAAIVNLYSPGDTLSLHRDVSEECGAPLVSVSLGCDGLFVIGLEGKGTVVLRLRSGDAVLMGGESRYAWHGVPKVVARTCPEWMGEWPGGEDGGPYEAWKGWMGAKRVNLNVRQMYA